MTCKNPHCDDYPYYGVAPHKHVGFSFNPNTSITFIGSTVIKPKEDWPKNFVEDGENAGLGVYYCPECLDGRD